MKKFYRHFPFSSFRRNKLQEKVDMLEKAYQNCLEEIKRLKEENNETSNTLHQLQNSIIAVDNRIDILYGEQNVT